MKNYLLIYTFTICILLIFNSCKKSDKKENIELNKIVNCTMSDMKSYNDSLTFIIDSLKQLKVYVPSKEEIEQKIPSPPPGKATNIIQLLNLNKNHTKNDSIKILHQNNYQLKIITLDKKINQNLKIINRNEKEKLNSYLSYSTPIYFENNIAYIEVGYYDWGFSKGIGYLLKREKGNWKIINKTLLWIT